MEAEIGWSTGLIFLIILIILILLLTHGYYSRQLRKKDNQIKALKESMSRLQDKLKNMEGRRAFRITLPDEACEFELIAFGRKSSKPLDQLKHKKGEGKIKDISRTGMKMSSALDLPVRKQIILQLYFVLDHTAFSLKGKIVRKEELMHGIFYGIEFVTTAKEQQQLYRVIQKIAIERNKQVE